MRNRSLNSVALKTRDAHAGMVSPAVFYKMHEGTGLVIADSLGNGPNFTVSAGTPLASNVGHYTPPASNTTVWAHAAVAADVAGVLSSIFDFSTEYSNILIGLDYEQGADIAAIQSLFGFGRTGTTTTGFFSLQLSATEILQIAYRGANCTAGQTLSLVSDLSGTSRSQILVDVARTGTNTFTASAYINGSQVGAGDGNWLNSSGTAPLGSAGFGDGYVLGGGPSGTVDAVPKQLLLNAGSGESSKLGRFFACRLTASHAGIGQAAALDLWRDRGEFPRSLIGL